MSTLGGNNKAVNKGIKTALFFFFVFFANYVIAALFWPFPQKQKSGNVEPSKLNFEDERTFLAHCE